MRGGSGVRDAPPAVTGVLSSSDVAATAATILAAQQPSGVIPWYLYGDADPWDHVECAMALSAAGERSAARRAYTWLRHAQRDDGSWPMRVRPRGPGSGEDVVDPAADTNQCAYVAVGVWHHVLVTGDEEFARWMWPCVRRALDFVLAVRGTAGEIAWARDAAGRVAGEVLVAGCSSIAHSLRCGLELAGLVEEPAPGWRQAADRLARVVAECPEVFADRRRYSMDWYYPILGGALRGEEAVARLDSRWEVFVVPGMGIRCVSDRPWVTGAETCELALVLEALGDRERAVEQLAAMQHLRHDDGSYWTGYVFADGVRWPVERSTWTAAAVILAADAVTDTTAGAGIFRTERVPATRGSAASSVPSG